MDYTSLFYWLTVADNAKTFFSWGIVIFMIIFVIAIIAHIVIGFSDYYDKEGMTEFQQKQRDLKLARKYIWLSAPFLFLFWSLQIGTPSKRDALLIVAGGQTLNYLTTDSTAKQIPHELTDFIVTEIRSMAKEAEVALDVTTAKERVLEQAKTMTTEELLQKMSEDVNFKEIILENIK